MRLLELKKLLDEIEGNPVVITQGEGEKYGYEVARISQEQSDWGYWGVDGHRHEGKNGIVRIV